MRALTPALLISLALVTVIALVLRDGEIAARGAEPVSPPALSPETLSPESLSPEAGAAALAPDKAPAAGFASARRALVGASAQDRRGAVHGRVVGSDGAALEGARVHLLRDGRELRAEENLATDASGEFRLEGLEPGDGYLLRVTCEGHVAANSDPLPVVEAGVAETTVRLRRDFRIAGRVRDAASGEPIAGALVSISDPLRTPGRERARATRTEEDGSYGFDDVGDGLRELSCGAPGFATEVVRYLDFGADSPAIRERDFELATSLTIAGRVVDASGRGLAEVRVAAFDGNGGHRAVTGADGAFAIEDVGPGTYLVEASTGNWRQNVPDVEAGSADVRITVDSEGSISGRIAVRGSDAPVSDFEIVVREAHPESPAYGRPVAEQSFRERADGRFRIDGISAGSYVLQVSAKGFATAFSRELRVGEARETGGLHVRMGPGAALTGRVVAGCSGDPLAGARVDLREDGWGDRDFAAVLGFASGLSRASLVTDADGRFAAEGLTAGTYEVRLSHADFQPVTVGGLELGEEGVRDLGRLELHRGSTITGTVRALDGAPAALVDVFLRTASPDAPFATSVTTDEEGRYRIRCSAGIYDLCAVRPPREPGLQGHLGTRISVGEGDERVQDLQLDTL